MKDPSDTLSRRFTDALARSEFASLRDLARASGNSVAMLSNLINGKSTAKHGPGLFAVNKAAQAMGLTLNDILPPETGPTVQEFLKRHPGPQHPNTSIQVFSGQLSYCDIYREPKGGLSNIKRAGPNSLVVTQSGLSDPALIQAEYLSWSKQRRMRIFKRQRRAWDTVKLSELDYFSEDSRVLNERKRVPFFIAICRVIDYDGEPVLVVFCEAMPE